LIVIDFNFQSYPIKPLINFC